VIESVSSRSPTAETPRVQLRKVVGDDLPVFYEQMHDPAARHMAAYTPRIGDAFFTHWRKIMADPAAWLSSVLADGEVAGHVASWVAQDQRLIGYWIGRPWWGRGIATEALRQFLVAHDARPLYAHVALENLGSIRVLEKNGFTLDQATMAALDTRADGFAERVYVLA
jgi:RimJ/RimL family protein N-acetyltransferase